MPPNGRWTVPQRSAASVVLDARRLTPPPASASNPSVRHDDVVEISSDEEDHAARNTDAQLKLLKKQLSALRRQRAMLRSQLKAAQQVAEVLSGKIDPAVFDDHVNCDICTMKMQTPNIGRVLPYQLGPKYTCPTCQTPVKRRPVTVFALKGIIHILESQGPSNDDQTEANGEDPWEIFFAPC
ncbi:hypothetical protein ARMGADRAFT_1033796 [Armillaria gallica]|uniref:Uncharacterized protein n=1 Tax=Armillaria gallica TaxID=47427 RepID=A0A2H3D0K4_ARMGA|nr:hypothetical protein ARMGADRAFT_1033796 [Armillaria gallica]